MSEWQITGWIDQGLNEKAYIIPGLGDFGERRYERAMHLAFLRCCVLRTRVLFVFE